MEYYQRNSFLQGQQHQRCFPPSMGAAFLQRRALSITEVRVAVPQLTERFRVFTAQMVFGRSVSRHFTDDDALLLQGLQRGAAIEITPYWVAGRNDRLRQRRATRSTKYFTLRG